MIWQQHTTTTQLATNKQIHIRTRDQEVSFSTSEIVWKLMTFSVWDGSEAMVDNIMETWWKSYMIISWSIVELPVCILYKWIFFKIC